MPAHCGIRDRIFGVEYPDNSFYGHAAILKSYAGVSLLYRVPGVVQHGWVGDNCGIYGNISEHGERERAATYFIWNRRNLARCRELGYRNAVAIGSPFLYLPDREPSGGEVLPRGLLLLPAHSCEWTRLVDPRESYRRYLDEVAELLSLFEPVSVCLYWYDMENEEVVSLFQERKIEVVSFGHRSRSPDFLYNFRRIVGRYAYVSSNYFGSPVFYALSMGKKAFVFGSRFAYKNVDPSKKGRRSAIRNYATVYPELLWENFNDGCRRGIADYELGAEFKRTPQELRALFGWGPAAPFRRAFRRVFPRWTRADLFCAAADFGNGLETDGGAELDDLFFRGYRIEDGILNLFFQAKRRMRVDYTIFTHAFPADASAFPPHRREHGFYHLDHDPEVPTRKWPRGAVYRDRVSISQLPAGTYRFEVGLINGGTVMKVVAFQGHTLT